MPGIIASTSMPRSKLIFAWVAAAIGIAAAISLGNWQTRRGDAKLILQAQADAAERAAPLEIAATRSSIESVAASLPRKVRATGVFDPTGTIFLDNRMLGGVAGYYVITPLLIGDGLPAVLIDRGWRARSAGGGANPSAPPTGQVSIEGLAVPRPSTLLELGSAPKLEVPGIWQNLDYDAYEKATKRSVARFVVRQAGTGHIGAADGLRREWPRPASGIEKHRGYAFQWYALAALISALAAYFGWKKWRER
jgi:surfeit locus 1 family protein